MVEQSQQLETLNYALNGDLVKKIFARTPVPAAQAILDAIAERLFERLDLLKETPTTVIDLGTGDGRHLSILKQRFPTAAVIGLDISPVRLHHAAKRRRFWQKRASLVCADAAAELPFKDASFDLLVANMLLPWVFDAEHLMSEINRLLMVGGAFFLSTAGPDTLIELRNAWAGIDDCTHVNAFMDMHDLGDLLVGAGIADPVLDTERITVSYPTLDALLKDLVGLGFINVLGGRRKGLTSATVVDRLIAHYPVNKAGGVDATLELVVAHGWAGEAREASTTEDFYFPLDRLKRGS